MDKSSKGKKKGKGKGKADVLKHGPPKSCAGDASQRKPKYPCLIYEEDHYTKACPKQSELSHLLKGTPAFLKEHFLS